MVLSQAETGKELTLVDIVGGRGIRCKLFSMGLIPGTKITVVNKATAGPIILRARDSRMALGRGMAEKIIVK